MAQRTSLVAAAVLFVIMLGVYLACGAPTVLFGDSGEFQTIGNIGGIAHQPGYPSYILASRAFSRLVPGEPARRMNAMSAFFGALSVCMIFALARRLGMRDSIAFGGALLFGATFTLWWCSLRAEVYTFALFCFLSSLWLALDALERPAIRRIAVAGFAAGITLTAHLCYAPALAAAGLLLIAKSIRSGLFPGSAVAAYALGVVAGFAPYLYFFHVDRGVYAANYLRYALEPGEGQFGLTGSLFDEPWERVGWLLTGKQATMNFYFADPRGLARNLAQVLKVEFVYHYGPLAIPLILAGASRLARRRLARDVLVLGVLGASIVFNVVCGAHYLRPLFLMPATAATALLVAAGLEAVLDRFALRRRAAPAVRLAVAAAIFAALLVTPHGFRVLAAHSERIPGRWKMQTECGPPVESLVPSLRHFRDARSYGERVLELAPPGAMVVGDFQEMMALFYLHYVEGRRPDLTLQLGFPEHLVRLERWHRGRDAGASAIVFTRTIPELMARFPPRDTLDVFGEPLYIHRAPAADGP